MNSNERRQAARRRLDERQAAASVELLSARPRLGWVRGVRDALGMTTRQLARRMGVAQATVVQLERSESHDTIQLGTLRRAADALDCDLVYALVPRAGSLERAVAAQARRRAEVMVRSVDRSMELEDQAVRNPDEVEAAVGRTAEQLSGSRRVWDE